MYENETLSNSILPSLTSYTGFSGFVSVDFSLSTPATRLPLARLIVSITNTIATIRRFIRIFIQYVSILVSSPVVSSLLTIIFAPNQLTRMIDA